MLNRRFATFAVFTSFATSHAQSPPLPLPPTVMAKQAMVATLPVVEKLEEIDPKTLSVKRVTGAWQLWANDKLFRSFGDRSEDANDVARTLRELYPQRWGRIGTDRVVVEYGLTLDNDQKLGPPQVAGFARTLTAMDKKTLRVERVRGVWCLRDDATLLLNFGQHQRDAEQALGVAQKYGFNRIGTVGRKDAVLTFFTSAPDGPRPQAALPAAVTFKLHEDAMTRTGIALPAVGVMGERKYVDPKKVEYVGELTRIDPRKVDLRTDAGQIVLASGQEILGQFGNDEFAARDALRVVRDARLTEFCKYGTAGVTFYLSNGQAPRNLPLHTMGVRFDAANLRLREVSGQTWLADANNRPLFPAGSREEAEGLKKLLAAFGFDQLCTVTAGGKAVMHIPAKAR